MTAISTSGTGRLLKYQADRGSVAVVLGAFAAHLVLWWYATET